MLVLRVAFAGTPEFALPALAALNSHHEIVGVLTQPDRPSGRGRRLSASPVKLAAVSDRLPLAQPPTLRSEMARAQLSGWRPDVLGWPRTASWCRPRCSGFRRSAASTFTHRC